MKAHNGGLLNKSARWLPVLVLLGNSCSPEPQAEPPLPREFGEPKLEVQLKDPAINESSGLARSHRFPGTYYTHNDSGDTALFWRFDLKGKVWGPYTVKGAEAVDWEDMASAHRDGKGYLYFGDIGDNAEKRESIQVYRVQEPDAQTKEAVGEKVVLKYPDGPHNAEALIVNPADGALWVVTKSSNGPSKVFRFSVDSAAGPVTGTEMGSIELGTALEASRLVTGGDLSEDGRYLVLRTYVEAHEFRFDGFPDWWARKPRRIATAPEIQGEAIAYSLDGKSLLTTSEFSPCPVSSMSIRSR